MPTTRERPLVLTVEDESRISRYLRSSLQMAGYDVLVANDGVQAMEQVQAYQPDLILLDLGLPHMNGYEVLQRVRETSDVPVIVLTALDTEDDKVKALMMGADDYIAKPFSPAQLVARVRAVLRRAGVAATSNILKVDGFTLDTSRREITHADKDEAISLTQLECKLLEALMLNSGQVLSADALISRIWGAGGADRVMLKQLVHRLRQKIEPDPTAPTYLETVPGVGYALVERVDTR